MTADAIDTTSRIAVGGLTFGTLLAALGFMLKIGRTAIAERDQYSDRVEAALGRAETALARCESDNRNLRDGQLKLTEIVVRLAAGLKVPHEQVAEVLDAARTLRNGHPD